MFFKLLSFLERNEKIQFVFLFGMILVMALFDVLGVASIFPLMASLADPSIVETNPYLFFLYEFFEYENPNNFLFFLGGIVFCIFVFSLVFKSITIFLQLRFTAKIDYSISKKLFQGYLGHPYSWFLNRHSAELGKTLLSEVTTVVQGAILPITVILAQGATVIAILILLIVVNPKISIIMGIVLIAAYASIFFIVNKYLAFIGKKRLEANEQRYKAVSEGFGAIKEVKLGGLEEAFSLNFNRPAKNFASYHASSQAILQLPRYLLEAILFGGMLLLMLYLLGDEAYSKNFLPLIALYAFAGYRVMPAVQLVYSSFSQLRYHQAAFENLHKDYMSIFINEVNLEDFSEPISFNKTIQLQDVSYAYPLAEKTALKDINMTIKCKQTIAFVGSTGSGKTTLADIILGILSPESGSLIIDEQTITEKNKRGWQKLIGYVPQNIYLADASVAENIAFGVDPSKIDYDQVKKAAMVANLDNFIEEDMPDGYKSEVGERGVRLSGGQRQRIGIARAMYHKPDILILDEATSALDNVTEHEVMDAINAVGQEITIILIAHRLSTVQSCDNLYFMQDGRIEDHGTFDELMKKNQKFKSMTQSKT
tara:strand:- start:2851 stop:4638 length:1788 start_codon:yes stop_codon:yes gene_type:complete